ncbi:MAG: hypothetical protein GY788_17510, partial [bacterium]|nr:hypothetical protein [bacterium]
MARSRRCRGEATREHCGGLVLVPLDALHEELVLAPKAWAEAALGLGAPALADELPTFTDDEFNDLFTNATLENLAPLEVPPAITGNAS